HHVRRGEGADPGDRHQARARRPPAAHHGAIPVRGHGDRPVRRARGTRGATLIVLGVDAIPTEGNEAMQYILNPKLSWPIALICVGILIGVGLLAGLLPARRAAAVDPVESLRYE